MSVLHQPLLHSVLRNPHICWSKHFFAGQFQNFGLKKKWFSPNPHSLLVGASAFVGKIHNSLLQKAAVSLSPTPGKVRILPLGFARSPDNMAEFTSG